MDKMKIELDEMGESQSYKVGPSRFHGEDTGIFFRKSQDSEKIHVAHSETGEPFSDTSDYIRFETIEDAEDFLNRLEII